ncbi:MAG: glycosyltransferase family 2 protein [Chlamydiales bacterium]
MISIVILTRNSGKSLDRTLQSTITFPEVIVLDSESIDDTKSIASNYANVRFHTRRFCGFGPMRSLADSLASHDWVFALDSDEVLSALLIESLPLISLKPENVYSFPRHNFFNDKWIRSCGWYPDKQIRLYNKNMTSFSKALVHEKVITKHMQIIDLKSPILHYSYNKMDDFLVKMQLYSNLFADQYTGKKKSSMTRAIGHSTYAFVKSFFLQKGFLEGGEGLLISLYNSHTTFYKYLKLWEKNKNFK